MLSAISDGNTIASLVIAACVAFAQTNCIERRVLVKAPSNHQPTHPTLTGLYHISMYIDICA